MPENIVAVIVTRNRLEKLKKAVSSILAQEVSGVVVVDNQSTDGTAAWLQSLSSDRVTVLTPATNLGGAGGFARGFARAMEVYEPDWLLCFDDDAYPADRLISRFQRTSLPEKTGIVAAAVFHPDESIPEMNRPLQTAPASFFSVVHYLCGGKPAYVVADGSYAPGNLLEIQASSFVGCFVSRQVIDTIGVPRGELFLYADDIIYTYQAFQAGYRNVFCADLVFYHDCFVKEDPARQPFWKIYFLLRNQIEMHRVFHAGSFWVPAIMRLGYYLLNLGRHRHRTAYLKLVCRAFYDGMRGRFDPRPWLYLDKYSLY